MWKAREVCSGCGKEGRCVVGVEKGSEVCAGLGKEERCVLGLESKGGSGAHGAQGEEGECWAEGSVRKGGLWAHVDRRWRVAEGPGQKRGVKLRHYR